MKKQILFTIGILNSLFSLAQSAGYFRLVQKGDSLYQAKMYFESGKNYSKAFRLNFGKISSNDYYNAACAYALAGKSDTAFYYLDQVVKKTNYYDYDHIKQDADLEKLHQDKRWPLLLAIVASKKTTIEAGFNKPLVAQLDSVFLKDQQYRILFDEAVKKYGFNSRQADSVGELMQDQDAANLAKVLAIIDRFGWLGPDVLGEHGSFTLYIVLQHADQATQEKYLPLLRAAVKNGKARSIDLAYMEDRVALDQGKKQIYGTQIHFDQASGLYSIAPIEDERHVNSRRAAMGMPPLEDYARSNHINYIPPVHK